MPTTRKVTLVAIALALASIAMTGDAQAKRGRGGRDHDDARRYYQDGRTLPLEQILQAARDAVGGGEVIEVEFEIKNGRPVCEVKIIDRSGRLREVYVDAETGRVLKVEDE
jgi:uncharacterized membrane protein YkoI